MPKLEVKEIKSVTGKAFQIPKRDENGDLVWKVKPEDGRPGEIEFVGADTCTALRHVMLNIPRSVQAAADSMRSAQLWNDTDQPKDGAIEIKEKVYKWVHSLLRREVPLTKEEAERKPPLHPLTYGRQIFGLSESTVRKQLMTDEDRKAEEQKEDAEE